MNEGKITYKGKLYGFWVMHDGEAWIRSESNPKKTPYLHEGSKMHTEVKSAILSMIAETTYEYMDVVAVDVLAESVSQVFRADVPVGKRLKFFGLAPTAKAINELRATGETLIGDLLVSLCKTGM